MKINKDLILDNETAFAYELSALVLEKPKMNVWMILIPIIIVFHMYRHKRYVDGRQAFAENYLITRKRALEAAYSACQSGERTDMQQFVATSDTPLQTREEYYNWVELLIEHYQMLITALGQDYESLVRDTYKTKMNYLLFLNRLNQAEQRFNGTLKPHINTKENMHVIEQTIAKIEHHSEILRRQGSDKIFS